MSRFKTGNIYLIRNKINGKRYVGQTLKSIEARLQDHFCTAKRRVSKLNLTQGL